MAELILAPPSDPISFFSSWNDEWLACGSKEPTAFTVATSSRSGRPSARTVLLKSFDQTGFVFYTNYGSHKSSDLDGNPQAEFLFYWDKLTRQVRIYGDIERTSKEESDSYFSSRPYLSQVGAWASEQSRKIPSREWLEKRVEQYSQEFSEGSVPRPEFWGGYRLKPFEFEFWQGRPNRLHDRIKYELMGSKWSLSRLSP